MTEALWFLSTVGLYGLADILYRRCGQPAYLHPVILPVVLLVAVFGLSGLPFAPFQAGTELFSELLLAAVAALALPLYRNFGAIRRDIPAVFAAIAGGSLSGVGGALAVALALGSPIDVTASLATKSVTTPIAVTVSQAIGGIPAIAAAVVICTGMVAALFGPILFRLMGVDRDEVACGLALGTAGHAIGMAEAVRRSDLMGAAAAFAMAANGLVTAMLLPIFWGFFGS